MIKLTPERLEQLQEMSGMNLKELKQLREQCLRYFGQSSAEVHLIALELRRRRSVRPELTLAVACLRKRVTELSNKVQWIDSLRFDTKTMLYDAVTLLPYEFRSRHDPEPLVGRLAYRVAVERIRQLEADIEGITQHIHIIQAENRLNQVTLDILELYDIQPERYKVELANRLQQLKAKCLPGTQVTLPVVKKRIIKPVELLGPQPGDYLHCVTSNKNYKVPGDYLIIAGGVGWTKYYCRVLMRKLEPAPGHRLFAARYLKELGYYVIQVPEDKCRPFALRCGYNRSSDLNAYKPGPRPMV